MLEKLERTLKNKNLRDQIYMVLQLKQIGKKNLNLPLEQHCCCVDKMPKHKNN
jgi:hypothetical protein